MVQYICEKFDETKCESDMEIHEVILSQYDIKPSELPINVQDLYMPEEEQDKMAEWIATRQKDFKIMNKNVAMRRLALLRLDIFPSAVRK